MKTPVIVGLGFGDEGKGTTVDFITSRHETSYVVRFSGGPQTAHNVVTDSGKHHTFSQFGAGTFNGAGTLATKHMLINPFNMVVEADHLIEVNGRNPFLDTLIDENALLITDVHRQANRQREINRGASRHGSCGEGIGETRYYEINSPYEALRMSDMADSKVLRAKLEDAISFYCQEVPGFEYSIDPNMMQGYAEMYQDIFQHIIIPEHRTIEIIEHEAKLNKLVFEGSQGVLLDEVHGFHPNTTWSDVTSSKAIQLLVQAGISREEIEIIGIMRTYLTRHGDGAFPGEWDIDESEWQKTCPEPHNGWGRWQGGFRLGSFDLELALYANEATKGIDSISLTHCDREIGDVIVGYKNGTPKPQQRNDDDTFSRDKRQAISDYVNGITPEDLIIEKDLTLNDLTDKIEANIAPVKIMSYGAETSKKKGDFNE